MFTLISIIGWLAIAVIALSIVTAIFGIVYIIDKLIRFYVKPKRDYDAVYLRRRLDQEAKYYERHEK